MSSGIYNIRNIKNGKIYIGSAINIKNRAHVHINELENNKHHSKHLQHSWNKYGKNNFVFEVIEYTDVQNLLEREQFWMDFFQSYFDYNGYNICKVAGSVLGLKHSDYSKKKMSDAKIGKDSWNKGKLNIYTNETKKKMSDAKIGNTWMLGKKASNESKRKMSDAKINKKASDETKKKMSDTRTGKKQRGKTIINTKGETFNHIEDVSVIYNLSISYLYKILKGHKKNTTDLSYLT